MVGPSDCLVIVGVSFGIGLGSWVSSIVGSSVGKSVCSFVGAIVGSFVCPLGSCIVGVEVDDGDEVVLGPVDGKELGSIDGGKLGETDGRGFDLRHRRFDLFGISP